MYGGNMKRKIASIMILLGVMAAFGFSASHFAGSSDSETGCSNATLKGTYGFYRTGTIPDGRWPLSGSLTMTEMDITRTDRSTTGMAF
jgi:hypothetical protein